MDTAVFTKQEFLMLIALVARLVDPDTQTSPLIKSVIYKAREFNTKLPDKIRIV